MYKDYFHQTFNWLFIFYLALFICYMENDLQILKMFSKYFFGSIRVTIARDKKFFKGSRGTHLEGAHKAMRSKKN